MTVKQGTYEDWKQVSGFHYRSHRVAFLQKIFVLKRKDRVCGAIVYVCPMSAAPCRSRVLKIENMQELIKNWHELLELLFTRNIG